MLKKEYVSPQMEIVEMEVCQSLLVGSSTFDIEDVVDGPVGASPRDVFSLPSLPGISTFPWEEFDK